jgi:hypothetical protein
LSIKAKDDQEESEAVKEYSNVSANSTTLGDLLKDPTKNEVTIAYIKPDGRCIGQRYVGYASNTRPRNDV